MNKENLPNMSSDFPFIHKNMFIVKKNNKYGRSRYKKRSRYDEINYETDIDASVDANTDYELNPYSLKYKYKYNHNHTHNHKHKHSHKHKHKLKKISKIALNSNSNSNSNSNLNMSPEISYLINDIKRFQSMLSCFIENEIPNKYVDYIMIKQIQTL
jgi:hypothetical protein